MSAQSDYVMKVKAFKQKKDKLKIKRKDNLQDKLLRVTKVCLMKTLISIGVEPISAFSQLLRIWRTYKLSQII